MKISAVFKQIAEASSDLQTLRKKLIKPSLRFFGFCKNLKILLKTPIESKIDKITDAGAKDRQFAFIVWYCWPSAQIDSHVFVASTKENNIPNTVIKSLACGIPCVDFI